MSKHRNTETPNIRELVAPFSTLYIQIHVHKAFSDGTVSLLEHPFDRPMFLLLLLSLSNALRFDAH
jgi:hypothetical protein